MQMGVKDAAAPKTEQHGCVVITQDGARSPQQHGILMENTLSQNSR